MANGDLFYSGGDSGGNVKTSYRYVKQDNRWDQKADMIEARSEFGCGRVTNPSTGNEEVVVAGGYNGGFLSSAEIYTDDEWRQGQAVKRIAKTS